MKPYYFFFILCMLCSACIENGVDEYQQTETVNSNRTMTRTIAPITLQDSLERVSKMQSDVNNLMMGRITFTDSMYVLSLKREDALFLGVSEDIYDKYLEFVDNLNNTDY